MLRAFVALVVFLVAFGAAPSARAAASEERDVQFTLTTSGARLLEGCGGDAAIELAVEERLHRRVFVDAALADDTLAIAFDEGRAVIVERDRHGTELGRREVPLPSGDCAKSLETIAVVLAIMIGPERRTTEPPVGVEAPPPEDADEGEPPPPPPPPKAKEQPPKKPSPRAHWAVAPVVEVAVGTGVMPGVAWAIEAGAVVTTPIRRLFGIARAEFWPTQYTPTRPTAEVTRLGGALLGCARLVSELSLCGGFDAGRLATESESFTRSSNATAVMGVLAEGRFGYRFAGPGTTIVEPTLAAQIAVIVRRDRFTYRDEAGRELTLLRPAPLAIQAGFGVALHFF